MRAVERLRQLDLDDAVAERLGKLAQSPRARRRSALSQTGERTKREGGLHRRPAHRDRRGAAAARRAIVCGSPSSWPASASARSAASSIVRAKTPTVSSGSRLREDAAPRNQAAARLEADDAAEGSRADDRAVGLRADARAAPCRRRPPRPSRRRSRPGVRAGSCGLRVLPGVKTASSVVTVLPRMMAPARAQPLHDRRVAATAGGRRRAACRSRSAGRACRRCPSPPTGTPCSGPIGRPVAAIAVGGLRLPHGVVRDRDARRPAPPARAPRCARGRPRPDRPPSRRRARSRRAPAAR